MHGVADAERDASHQLAVDQRGIHGAADVGADHDPTQGDGAGLLIDVGHDRRRAAGVRHLRHLERSAGGQSALARELGEGDAPPAGRQHTTRVGHLILRDTEPLRGPLARLGDQLRGREVGRVARGDRPARAVGSHTALDGGGVGVPHVEARRGKPERVAQDLRQHGLEPGSHRRGAGVDDQPTVGPRLHLRGLEGAEAGLLDVDRQADPTARTRRPRIHRGLLSARARVVQAPQQLVEEPGEIAGVVDGADAE